MLSWFHNYSPERVVISLGPISIYWYGLCLALAVLAALGVVLKLEPRRNLSKEQGYNLVFYTVIFGLLGARLWEVFLVSWFYYSQNLLDIFKVWQGGLAIHGGILGGIITLVIYCRRQKINFWLVADVLAPALALGQAIGRWGNFFNQELFGYPTSLPWGIYITPINRPEPWLDFKYFHPTFLYESLASLIIFALLWWQFNKLKTGGQVFWLYLILYSAARFTLEFMRIDPEPSWWGLKLPQWASLLIVIAAVSWLLALKKKSILTSG